VKIKLSIPPIHAIRNTQYASRPGERGMAVISVLALVAIVLIYMAANIRTLNTLDGELKLLERQQTTRLKSSSRTAKTVRLPNAAKEPQPAHE
jgi:hypothetical protein